MTTPSPEAIAAAMPAAEAVVQKILCYAPDYFKPSKQLQLSWAEHIAAYAPHVPVEDLLAGVTAYYGTNIDGSRPTQAAITQAARQLRHERFLAEDVEVQNRRAELRDAARAELLYDAEPAVAIEAPRRRPESIVAAPEYTDCPTCGSRAGFPCRNTETAVPFTNGFHMARENAAARVAAEKRRALRKPNPLDQTCPTCQSAAGEKCHSGGLPMFDVHPERRA